jgi:hypothetical protein
MPLEAALFLFFIFKKKMRVQSHFYEKDPTTFSTPRLLQKKLYPNKLTWGSASKAKWQYRQGGCKTNQFFALASWHGVCFYQACG